MKLQLTYPNLDESTKTKWRRSLFILLRIIAIVYISYFVNFLYNPYPDYFIDPRAMEQFALSMGIADEKSFVDIAREVGLDKVRVHPYQCLYEDGLVPYRHVPGIRILEIGLGCHSPLGPDKPMRLWYSYFLSPNVTFLEENRACAEDWKDRWWGPNLTILIGSQRDGNFLRSAGDEYGAWDIIIDGGGHINEKQVKDFAALFQILRPGGAYFIENLDTSRENLYGGLRRESSGSQRKAITFITQIFANSIRDKNDGANLERITCCDQICALTKSGPKFK